MEHKLQQRHRRVIYMEDQLWFELQGALRADRTDVSKWLRLVARKYLDKRKLSNN